MTADSALAPADVTPGRPRRGRAHAWRSVAASAVLAAGTVSWAALPANTGRGGFRIALITAIAGAALSLAQVALTVGFDRSANGFPTIPERIAEGVLGVIRAVPWAELMLVAVLVLEALHPARPWHTGVLGLALLAYLLAVHLAESGARPVVLWPQLPVIAAGLGLLALAVGAASLPQIAPGPTTTGLRILAIVAVVIAAALAVPLGGPRRQ